MSYTAPYQPSGLNGGILPGAQINGTGGATASYESATLIPPLAPVTKGGKKRRRMSRKGESKRRSKGRKGRKRTSKGRTKTHKK
jgi:hypothetical protein